MVGSRYKTSSSGSHVQRICIDVCIQYTSRSMYTVYRVGVRTNHQHVYGIRVARRVYGIRVRMCVYTVYAFRR